MSQAPPAQPSKIPMTRPVTITIHEPMFEPMKRMAEEYANGSVSELLRMLLYSKLMDKKYITTQDFKRMGY